MSKSVSLPLIPSSMKMVHTKSIQNLRSNKPTVTNTIVKNTGHKFYFKPSREMDKRGSIECFPGSIGLTAKLDFVHTYKNRIKITDRNSFERLESTPSAAYLEIIDKKKLRPMAFGIVRNTGNESDLNVQGLSMGDNYAQALSEGIQRCRSIERLNLKDNRLSEKGLTSILGKIEVNKIKHLCLSDNCIGSKVVKQISDILIDPKCNLKHLILESTKLNDSSVITIFEAVSLNSSITKLNLARNSFTENCGKVIKAMLGLNSTLKTLDLHWNQLKGPGIVQIFEGLEKNTKLKELDLSWNLMTRNLDNENMKIVANILAGLQKLKHLDLSSNYLGADSCEILGEGLKKNHFMLGIHMLGNDCRVDSRGFVHADSYVSKVEQGHIKNRIFSDKKPKNFNLNSCWLCEGWAETKFVWTGEVAEPVCIHLECDDFQPDLMVKDENVYSIVRVVPAGKVRFFFSVNLVIMKAKDFMVTKLAQPIEKEIVFWNSVKVTLFITNLNQSETINSHYNMKDTFKCLPRVPKQVYMPPKTDLEKIPWSMKISIFYNYTIDNEYILDDCFEFDWNHSRIFNIIKKQKELDSVKSVLRQHYHLIKEAYKTLASYSGGEIPCVGSNTMTDLLNQCQVFDQYYQVTDFGVNWSTALVQTIKNQVYNPGNSLVRYEFLEILVRIAFDKYIRTKICTSLPEAISTLMEKHFIEKFESLNSSTWRSEKYFTELTDVTLKVHKAIWEALFKKYSGRKTLPGQKPFMSVEEFRELCSEAGLVNDTFSTREIDVCFYQAMMSQADEIFKKRHTEMNNLEFLEAITRACDLSGVTKMNYEEISQGVKEMTLQQKIENACKQLLSICPLSVQESFVFPTEKTYEKLMYKPKGSLLRSSTLNLLDVSY